MLEWPGPKQALSGKRKYYLHSLNSDSDIEPIRDAPWPPISFTPPQTDGAIDVAKMAASVRYWHIPTNCFASEAVLRSHLSQKDVVPESLSRNLLKKMTNRLVAATSGRLTIGSCPISGFG